MSLDNNIDYIDNYLIRPISYLDIKSKWNLCENEIKVNENFKEIINEIGRAHV